ncbi:hypothetical protein BH10ACI2_BH10ACI2_11570 [soil metagenome]
MKVRVAYVFCLVNICFLLMGHIVAQDKGWRPISPEETQQKKPKVEPDADAEVLLWEVRVADEFDRLGFRTTLDQYVRIKIFNERGRDEYGKIDIPFGNAVDAGVDITLKDIAARTIKADGTIIEVRSADIFERDIVKSKDLRLKAKSFVMPGIEAGSIIEYRWREIRNNALSLYVRLEYAREIPVQFVKYYVKPLSNIPIGMRLHSINTETQFQKEKDGFYSSSMSNVPSFKPEPSMPSEYSMRPWVLVFYDNDEMNITPQEYWRDKGKKIFETYKVELAPTDDLRRAAKQTVGDAATPEDAVHRIFDFCRKSIKNVDSETIGIKPDERKNFKENKNATDTLKHGYGTARDIDMLFGAMIAANGMDVRVANAPVSTDPPLNKTIANFFFIRSRVMAVKVGSDWRFFAPSLIYEPFGSLCYCQEGQSALVSDPKEPFWIETQSSEAGKSKQSRKITAALNEDGTIEGEAKIEYTGHLARYYRQTNDGLSPAEREKFLTEMMKTAISPTVEISAISIDNIRDAEKPFTYIFKFKVPAYVERTGKRLFLQPNVFEKATTSRFMETTRRYDIVFGYPWTEEDEIAIKLPVGYSADNSETWPAVLEPHGVGSMISSFALSEDRSTLIYKRKLAFGAKGSQQFDKSDYSSLKSFFDAYNQADKRAVILEKQAK